MSKIKKLTEVMNPEPKTTKQGRFQLTKAVIKKSEEFGAEVVLTPRDNQQLTEVVGTVVKLRQWGSIDKRVSEMLLRVGTGRDAFLIVAECRKEAFHSVNGLRYDWESEEWIADPRGQICLGETVKVIGRYCESIFKGDRRDLFKRVVKAFDEQDIRRKKPLGTHVDVKA